MSQSPNQDQKLPTVSKKDAIKRLWHLRRLHWKLDANQLGMYNFIKNCKETIVVIGASRQLGKSFMLCTIAIEECIQFDNRVVKIIAPEVKMIRRIMRPLMREILQDCPEELVPSYTTADHIYKFPNGSEIQIAGTDNGHAESIRGTKAHLCIVDEAGFCSDLKYIVQSILIPTTTTTQGKIILSSTPSKSNDHDFVTFWHQAEANGAFIKRTIYDNPRLTAEQIEQLARAIGGKNSVDFRREFLCELITSEDDAIIPEFNLELEEEIVKEWARPPYYDAYTAMDIGFRDLTVVLYGYYDFKNAKIIIEDETVISGKKLLTDDLAKMIQDKEKKLWISPMTLESKSPVLRISDDNNLILLNDLQGKHNLTFLPVYKDSQDAMLNNLRMLIKKRQIIINPRCKTLIAHLRYGIWNKSRTSYMRSSDNGHFDAIDSLKYMARSINFQKNPYPADYTAFKTADRFMSPGVNSRSPLEDNFIKLFQKPRNSRINK